MTPPPIAELPGGPYDLEFFFDPGCPFAWQTSVWVRNVVAETGLRVGWRFISLWYINLDHDVPPAMKQAQAAGLRYHRICAAARERFGNDAVGNLYRLFGESYWYTELEGDLEDRLAVAASNVDVARLIEAAGLPATLIDAADDESYDAVIQAESSEAFERTGPDVGTPILTFDPPHGNSLFGPVISSVPEGADAVRLMDAVRVVASFESFSEFKRTKRAPLDLPLFA